MSSNIYGWVTAIELRCPYIWKANPKGAGTLIHGTEKFLTKTLKTGV